MHRNIRLLAWFNFFTDFRPFTPVMVLYFTQVTGSFTLGMTVMSVTMISSSIFEVPTGILSDLAGRRGTMILGSLAGTLNVLLWAIGGSFWILAAGSAFAGLARAFFSGNNQAFLHDTLKEEGREHEYSHYLGRTSALFQMGLGTSALLGGLVAENALSLAMWLGVIPQLLCVAVALLMREPIVHDRDIETNVFHHLRESLRQFRRNPRLRSLTLASMIDFGVGQAQFYFMPMFYASLLPLWAVGLARSLGHALACISFWCAGWATKKVEPLRALMGSKCISHIVLASSYIARFSFSPFVISATSIFFGVKTVAESTLLHREFTDEQRATMGSLNQFGGNIINAIASLGFGVLADNFGLVPTLLASEIILFSTLVLYRRAFR